MSDGNDESLTLVSNDGFQFIISKKTAFVSKTIRNMFNKNSGYIEATENRVTFEDMSAPVLEKVCEYWCYREKYTGVKGQIPDFAIPPEMSLELMTAADYLET